MKQVNQTVNHAVIYKFLRYFSIEIYSLYEKHIHIYMKNNLILENVVILGKELSNISNKISGTVFSWLNATPLIVD